ncbi:MAG: Uma2 family endonuclease [Verrucomicrobiales bacterium]|jgi:Uma2 family endonuclease
MNWQEVCEDPQLRDLSYKVELNRFGQIVMSPASNEHGYFQTRIGWILMDKIATGKPITECSISTAEGVKVADVAWGSNEFFELHGLVTPLPNAPEICVEIISPSNSKDELDLKTGLYFEAGAKEVWLCDSTGNMEFRKGGIAIEKSEIVPDFPLALQG